MSFSLLKPEQWDRHKHLRGALILGMTVCAVGSVDGWYHVAQTLAQSKGLQLSELRGLILLSALAVVILFAVPRKWELITLSIGLTFILSIIGTLLRRAPLGIGLEIVLTTGVLYFGCVYVGQKLKERKGK